MSGRPASKARPCARATVSRLARLQNPQAFPAGALLVAETERGRKVVDARSALVGAVTLLADPKEALSDDQLRQCGAILALRRFAELLAQRLERGVVQRLRRRHGDRLVGPGLGRLLLLAARQPARFLCFTSGEMTIPKGIVTSPA